MILPSLLARSLAHPNHLLVLYIACYTRVASLVPSLITQENVWVATTLGFSHSFLPRTPGTAFKDAFRVVGLLFEAWVIFLVYIKILTYVWDMLNSSTSGMAKPCYLYLVAWDAVVSTYSLIILLSVKAWLEVTLFFNCFQSPNLELRGWFFK